MATQAEKLMALEDLKKLSAALSLQSRVSLTDSLRRITEALGGDWGQLSFIAGRRPRWHDPAQAMKLGAELSDAQRRASSERNSQARIYEVAVREGDAYYLTMNELSALLGRKVTTLASQISTGRGQLNIKLKTKALDELATVTKLSLHHALSESELAQQQRIMFGYADVDPAPARGPRGRSY